MDLKRSNPVSFGHTPTLGGYLLPSFRLYAPKILIFLKNHWFEVRNQWVSSWSSPQNVFFTGPFSYKWNCFQCIIIRTTLRDRMGQKYWTISKFSIFRDTVRNSYFKWFTPVYTHTSLYEYSYRESIHEGGGSELWPCTQLRNHLGKVLVVPNPSNTLVLA